MQTNEINMHTFQIIAILVVFPTINVNMSTMIEVAVKQQCIIAMNFMIMGIFLSG